MAEPHAKAPAIHPATKPRPHHKARKAMKLETAASYASSKPHHTVGLIALLLGLGGGIALLIKVELARILASPSRPD